MLVQLVYTKIKSTLRRLNSNILNNPATKEKLNIGIKSYLEHNDNEEVMPSVLWDALKVVIRGKMIAISFYEKKMCSFVRLFVHFVRFSFPLFP